MIRPRLAFNLIAVCVLAGATLLPLAADAQSGIDAALAWLRGQQQADGGFSNGFSPESDIGTTADAIVAIAAVGGLPSDWGGQGKTPLDFLEAHAGSDLSAGQAAKVALAAVAAGRDPRALGDVDVVEILEAGLDPTSGLYGGGAYDTALVLLALHAAGQPLPQEVVAALAAARLPDGSYSFDAGQTPGSGDSNTTALVVQALHAAGAEEQAAPSIGYFRDVQNPDGGWTYQKPSAFGESTDANSTALVLQALMAAGEDLEAWGQPTGALISLQQPSGAFAFNADAPADNLLATVQALPALAGIDLTEVAGLAAPAAVPTTGGGASTIAIGAAVLLVAAMVVAGILGRKET